MVTRGKTIFEKIIKKCQSLLDKIGCKTIITNLTAYLQTPLEQGKTRILFDEVQEKEPEKLIYEIDLSGL